MWDSLVSWSLGRNCLVFEFRINSFLEGAVKLILTNFIISTWNQADFQTHFSTILDRQSELTEVNITCFLPVRNQNNPTKDLESEQNEFESRFGSKLRSGNTCI